MRVFFVLLISLMLFVNDAKAQNLSVPSLRQLLVQKGYSYSQKQDNFGNYTYYYSKGILLIVMTENAQSHNLKNTQATLIVDDQPQTHLQKAVNDLSAFLYKITDNAPEIAQWLSKCLARNSMNIQVYDKNFQYKCFMLGHSSVFLATPIK